MRRRIFLPLTCLAVMVLMAPAPVLPNSGAALDPTESSSSDGIVSWVQQGFQRLEAWLSSINLPASQPTSRGQGPRTATAQSESSDDDTEKVQATTCELETCSELGPQVDPDG